VERLSSGAAANRIKFENPPINELIIALFHLPITEIKAQHIGIYWNRIRDRYPRCEQRPIIVSSPSDPKPFPEAPGEIFPLPRFWFFRDNHPTLIQIQRNAFLLNWRRGNENEYPHYETVVKDFWQELEGYRTFVQEWGGEGFDVIQRCELNYINIVTTNEVFANPAELMNVLPSIASLSDFQNESRQMIGLNATVTYQVHETLRIDMAIRLGHRSDTTELVAILDLKAHGVPSNLSFEETRSWYDSAHDIIYKTFLDATSKKIQERIWKPL
jgi:uncharacterized protein (TIGR04255 family)